MTAPKSGTQTILLGRRKFAACLEAIDTPQGSMKALEWTEHLNAYVRNNRDRVPLLRP